MVLAGLITSACSPERDDPAAQWASTVAWLRWSADESLAEGRLDRAETDLRRALALPRPSGDPAAQLLQDIDFALGSVLLAQGDPAGARAAADTGIARTPTASVFLANLHALRGMALETAGEPLEAAEAYTHALDLHRTLYERLLARPPDGKP